MPHEIEIFADGTAAFVSANTPAWHRLGTVADGPMSVPEALKLAKLDQWDVRMEPLVAAVPNGKCVECSQPKGSTHDDLCVTGDHDGEDDSRLVDEHDTAVAVEVPNNRAVVRTHPITGQPHVLAVGGLDYTPISNEVMGETLQAILDTSGAIVDTAGSLRDGLDTFITARLPKGILVGGVDPVELNLAGLNYFQPGKSSEFLITPVRVVCANTQAAALASHRSRYAVRHSPNAPERIIEARNALQISFDYRDAFADEAEKMIMADLAIRDFEKLCREIWPKPDEDANAAVKERDDLRTTTLMSVFKGESNANIGGKRSKGTHWSGYQTVVEYMDHHAPVKDAENAARIRAERALFGKALDTKELAFKLFQVA
jgi:phage/plasmid-like protein (TIGR03299 family)